MDEPLQLSVERAWSAFDRLGPLRDPLAALLLPISFEPPVTLPDRILTARWIRTLPRSARGFAFPGHLREWTLRQAQPHGLFLEFGVANGFSTRHIARTLREIGTASRLFAFDSFRGLPERWSAGRVAGAFAQTHLPEVEENTTLVVGLFQHTLADFLDAHPEAVSFVHIDSDLYSSALFVLKTLLSRSRLVEGTTILFDELVNYPGWTTGGEFRALTELWPNETLEYEVVGMVPNGTQVAIRLRRK